MTNKNTKSASSRAMANARIAATAALVAGMMASAYHAYGHGGDTAEHDYLIGTIPGGTSSLLPDDRKNRVTDGEVGPLLPMHTMSVHNTLTWKKDSKMP